MQHLRLTWGPKGTIPRGGVILCIGPAIFGCPTRDEVMSLAPRVRAQPHPGLPTPSLHLSPHHTRHLPQSPPPGGGSVQPHYGPFPWGGATQSHYGPRPVPLGLACAAALWPGPSLLGWPVQCTQLIGSHAWGFSNSP